LSNTEFSAYGYIYQKMEVWKWILYFAV
jgi:hypothetical protein